MRTTTATAAAVAAAAAAATVALLTLLSPLLLPLPPSRGTTRPKTRDASTTTNGAYCHGQHLSPLLIIAVSRRGSGFRGRVISHEMLPLGDMARLPSGPRKLAPKLFFLCVSPPLGCTAFPYSEHGVPVVRYVPRRGGRGWWRQGHITKSGSNCQHFFPPSEGGIASGTHYAVAGLTGFQ